MPKTAGSDRSSRDWSASLHEKRWGRVRGMTGLAIAMLAKGGRESRLDTRRQGSPTSQFEKEYRFSDLLPPLLSPFSVDFRAHLLVPLASNRRCLRLHIRNHG